MPLHFPRRNWHLPAGRQVGTETGLAASEH